MMRRTLERSWWVVAAGGLLALLLALPTPPSARLYWGDLAIASLFVAIIINFPIPIGEWEADLVHVFTVPVGLALGAAGASWVLVAGVPLGQIVRWLRERRPKDQLADQRRQIRGWALGLAGQGLSILVALQVYQAFGGRPLVYEPDLPPYLVLPLLAFSLSFAAMFVGVHALFRTLQTSEPMTWREAGVLALSGTLPIAPAIAGAATFARLGTVAVLAFGSILAVLAPVVRRTLTAERDLQRRLSELSTLNRVSQAMRTSLDLNSILTTIYLQVAHLLKVDNFYVALHDQDDGTLSYPLAIKNGQRQHWQARPLADRLTDRVIQTGAPILLAQEAPRALREMGLPELQNAPEAWLGVPLLSASRAIGCLAVFHNRPGATLTDKDLDLLVTLAGQAAVAIENALLYEQTRRRAQALGSLHEITASMISSLDPERTLELVGQSLIRVGGGQKSAIFLLDSSRGQLFLASATDYSKGFMRALMTVPLDDEVHAQAFRTGEPVLVPDLASAALPKSYVDQLRSEDIESFADLPLRTPAGMIGQISVYFSQPQRFRPDEVELLMTFAAQAALAVANAQAHAETDQALRRRVDQLSILEAVGREMSITLDPSQLFETILEHALRFTTASTGHVALYEAEAGGLRVVAQRGYPAGSPPRDGGLVLPVSQGVAGRVYHSGSACIVPELRLEPGHTDWSGGQSQSLLCVPILRQERCLGVITVESLTPSAFTAEHEHLVSQLAAQAASALTSATLYRQLEERLREQSLLFQASAQLAATLESEAVGLAVAESLAVAVSADSVSLSRWIPGAEVISEQAAVSDGRPVKRSDLNAVLLTEVPALTACMKQGTPVQYTLANAPTPADRRHLAERRRAASLLAVPLLVGDQCLGLLEILRRKPREFDDNALRIALTIASQAGIALQNTDLFQRISESHDRLLAVLNSTQEGMVMADTSGRIVLANHQLETLTGIPAARLAGVSLADTSLQIPGRLGFRQAELANLMAGLRSGDAMPLGSTTYEASSPPRRTLQRSDAPVRDAAGQLIGWLVVLRDISEERKLDEAREQLTEMIVHDLRSPLTAILGSMTLLESCVKDSGQSSVAEQAVSVSSRSCEQMLELVNSLLDIAKLESGELELNLEPIELPDLALGLLGPYIQEANGLGIILNYRFTPALPEVRADRDKLRRVLANLIDNALKFTPPGGHIDLSIEADGDEVLIGVADTGPGVPDDARERIFERFAQVPGAIARRRGTGLGLAFSKLAVDAHGGRIWVEDNPGGGSLFRIRLPVVAAAPERLPVPR